MPWVDIQAEFVVAATEILNECVPGADHPCRAESFQTTHRPQPSRQTPRISLDGLFPYCSVTWHAAGISSSITRG